MPSNVPSVAVATNTRSARAKAIQQAMSQAILECNAEGISTSEENSPLIRERMMAARQRVVEEFDRHTQITNQKAKSAAQTAAKRDRSWKSLFPRMWGKGAK